MSFGPLVAAAGGGLSAAQVGLTLAGAALQIVSSRAQVRDERARNAAMQAELQRQSDENDRIAQEQKSDRARQADKEFASMIADMADMGGLATTDAVHLGAEIGYLEGVDLARIEGNRKAEAGRIAQDSENSNRRARSAVEIGRVQDLSTIVGTAGTGLTIRARADARKTQRELAKRTV